MKIKTLLLLGMFALAMLPVRAELTVDDVSSREYLINHGHASSAADIVELTKGSVNGAKVYLPVDYKYENKPLVYKWVDKFFIYLDPAQDNGKFLREDTKFYPNVDDL